MLALGALAGLLHGGPRLRARRRGVGRGGGTGASGALAGGERSAPSPPAARAGPVAASTRGRRLFDLIRTSAGGGASSPAPPPAAAVAAGSGGAGPAGGGGRGDAADGVA